jgi:hypothetical protein
MRSSALPTLLRKPSCVWENETAFPTLSFAAWMRLTWASNFSDTAVPAASSAGEFSFYPEDNRASDFCNDVVDSLRIREAIAADGLVLMTTIFNSFL